MTEKPDKPNIYNPFNPQGAEVGLALARSVGDGLADINDDGRIDAADVQLIINTVLGLIG